MRKGDIRRAGWAALLPLFALAASVGTRAQSLNDSGGLRSNGSYLHSYLKAPEQEAPCPPNIDPIYRADAIVTGTDMRQRPWGFAQTFRAVLVKSSGDPRLQDDPRVAHLAERAGQSVACFSYADMMAGIPLHDEQGTYDRPHRLAVTFDPAKIDAILADFGDKPWHGERPVIVPVLLVRGPKPPSYLLSAETPRGDEQRGAFATAAGEFGMLVRFPSDKELAAWDVGVTRFPGETPSSRAGEAPTEAVVAGTLDWSEALPGWVGKWHTRWHGADHDWSISGVNYDAAFRDIVRGVVLLASGNGAPE